MPIRSLPASALVLPLAAAACAAIAALLARSADAATAAGLIALVPVAVLAARAPEYVLLLAMTLVAAEGSLQAYVGFAPFAVVQGLLAAYVVGTLARVFLARRRVAVVVWPAVVPMVLFIILSLLDILPSESISLGLQGFREGAYFLVIGGFVAFTLDDEGARRRLVRGIVLLAFAVGAYATYRYAVGPDPRELANASKFNRNIRVNGEPALVGSFTQRSSLARWAVTALPLCLAAGLLWRGPWRHLATVAGALCAVALLGSEVRTGLPAALLGVLAVLQLQQFSRALPGLRLGTTVAAITALLLVGSAAWAATIASDPQQEQRYARILTPDQDATYNIRRSRWPAAVEVARDHPFGLGLGTSGRGARDAVIARYGTQRLDNSYLQIAIEQGFGGLALFVLALICITARLARHAITTIDREQAVVAMAGTGALLGTAVFMYTSSAFGGFNSLQTWALIGLGAAGFSRVAPRPVG